MFLSTLDSLDPGYLQSKRRATPHSIKDPYQLTDKNSVNSSKKTTRHCTADPLRHKKAAQNKTTKLVVKHSKKTGSRNSAQFKQTKTSRRTASASSATSKQTLSCQTRDVTHTDKGLHGKIKVTIYKPLPKNSLTTESDLHKPYHLNLKGPTNDHYRPTKSLNLKEMRIPSKTSKSTTRLRQRALKSPTQSPRAPVKIFLPAAKHFKDKITSNTPARPKKVQLVHNKQIDKNSTKVHIPRDGKVTAVKCTLTAVKRTLTDVKIILTAVKLSRSRQTQKICISSSTNMDSPRPTHALQKVHMTRDPENKSRERHVPAKYKSYNQAKYKFHKVQISCERHVTPKYKFHKGHKVQRHATPKYKSHKGHKVQRHTTPKYKFQQVHKVQTSCSHHVTPKYRFHKVQTPCRSRGIPPHKHNDKGAASPPSTRTLLSHGSNGLGPAYRNNHTPYGPYNLPHMVLCTKKGPDNA